MPLPPRPMNAAPMPLGAGGPAPIDEGGMSPSLLGLGAGGPAPMGGGGPGEEQGMAGPMQQMMSGGNARAALAQLLARGKGRGQRF